MRVMLADGSLRRATLVALAASVVVVVTAFSAVEIDHRAREPYGTIAVLLLVTGAAAATVATARSGWRATLPAVPLVLAVLVASHTKVLLALVLIGLAAWATLSLLRLLRAASRADRGWLAVIGGAGLAFVAAFALLHADLFTSGEIRDTPVYQWYGKRIVAGEKPYDEVAVEYPPGALAVFVPGAIGAGEPEELTQYNRVFEGFMATFGLATIVLAGLVLRRLRATRARTLAALGFIALAPLALGAVYLSRFDAFPAALTVASLTLLVFERPRLAAGVLAAGLAAKLYPLVFVPLVAIYVGRRCGRTALAQSAAVFVAVLAAIFLPFALTAPTGLFDALERQVSRSLQVESLGASLLMVAHHTTSLELKTRITGGSQDLIGSLPDAVATAQSVLQIALLVVIWMVFARGPTTPDRLIRFFAASLAAFIALSKVASPQFLIWLIPLVGLVGGRRGVASAAALTVALVLTQLWFPRGYWDLVAFEFPEVALVMARDVVLLALTAMLALDEWLADEPSTVGEPAHRIRAT